MTQSICNPMLDMIQAMANKEISLCKTDEDLLRVGKFWKKYFAEMNKYIAGKRDEPPYCSGDGKSVI